MERNDRVASRVSDRYLCFILLAVVLGCGAPNKEPVNNTPIRLDPLAEEPIVIANPTPIMFVTPTHQDAVVVDRMSTYSKTLSAVSFVETLPVIHEYKNWFELLPSDTQRQFIRKVFVMNELDVPLPNEYLNPKYENLEISLISRTEYVRKRKNHKPGPFVMLLQEDVYYSEEFELYKRRRPANMLIYKPGDSSRIGGPYYGLYAWGRFTAWSPVCEHDNYSDCAGFWDDDTFYAAVLPARVDWAPGSGDLREKFDSTYNFRYIKIMVKGPGIGEPNVGEVSH